jgi:hypothetical protein
MLASLRNGALRQWALNGTEHPSTDNKQLTTDKQGLVMKKRRILIIEDEANMRHMLEVLLEKSGFEVT